jgi:ring-1,2-phenylacetyl-CoA epoxidase subunit PaaA
MRRLYDDGVIDATPDTLRSRYLAAIMPALSRAGLEEPIIHIHGATMDTWRPAEPLPWARWDAAQRRLGVA